jgi:hypothetical protein
MPTPIQPFFVRGFKDWRPDLAESQMDPSSLTVATNIMYTHSGAVRKRDGFVKITDDVAVQDETDFFFAPRVFTTSTGIPNFNQHAWLFNKDTGRLFHQTLGELMEEYQFNTGTLLQNSTHTMGSAAPNAINYFRVWPISVITFASNIYATTLRYGGYSGTDGSPTYQTESGSVGSPTRPLKYDAQAGTFTRPVIHALAGATSGFPGARCAITKYDRVFVANVHKEGVFRYPSRIYWSNAGTAETFESSSYIDVGADDGAEITALLPFGEQILVFKNDSVWALTGTDEDTFALYQLEDKIGTESTFGVYAYMNTAYFFDYRTGIWGYDGARFAKISDPIDEILLNGINREAILKAFLMVHEDRLYCSVPWNEVTTPADVNTKTFVYDLQLRAWAEWTVGMQPAGAVYTTDFNNTGPGVKGDNYLITAFDDRIGLFQMDPTVITDGGQAMDAVFETTWMNPGNAGDRHRIRRLEFLFEQSRTDMVKITLYRDFDETTVWRTYLYSVDADAAGLKEGFVQEARADGQWFQFVKFKFETQSATDDIQLNGFGMNVSDRAILRGTVHHMGYSP